MISLGPPGWVIVLSELLPLFVILRWIAVSVAAVCIVILAAEKFYRCQSIHSKHVLNSTNSQMEDQS